MRIDTVPSPTDEVRLTHQRLPTPMPRSRVALTHGPTRYRAILDALRMLADDIQPGLSDRPVLIKPNLVVADARRALAVTHPEAAEAVIAFLRERGVRDLVIAESCAEASTREAYAQFGYLELSKRHGVPLVDLNEEPGEPAAIRVGTNWRTVRLARRLCDPRPFIISLAPIKTHDCVIVTLSLKNVIMGAPLIDPAWHATRRKGQADKPLVHGRGFQDLHDNLYLLAPRVWPDLAVLDGFIGMEGCGPSAGDPVQHGVVVASLDPLAADRVALELMGVCAEAPAYLSYCGQAGYGHYNLDRIELAGESLDLHRRKYRLHPRWREMLGMRPTPPVLPSSATRQV